MILPAPAQESSPGRAYFYSEPDYRGEFFVVEADAQVPNLRREYDRRNHSWNDRISSIRVEGPVRVIVNADGSYKGDRLELTRGVRDLAERPHGETGLENWDDRISSIRVVIRGAGERDSFFNTQREADRAIQSAYREFFDREPDYSGLQTCRRRLLDEGWNVDDLRRSLRRSDEFRQRDVAAIVRRAYLAELGREPDGGGLAAWTGQLKKHGWTENELRAELRRSDEAREKLAREIVDRAYRDLLGREPDAEGRAVFVRRMLRDNWTEQKVRDAIRKSPEYRQRTGGR